MDIKHPVRISVHFFEYWGLLSQGWIGKRDVVLIGAEQIKSTSKF